MNKIIGAGLGEPLDEAALGDVERCLEHHREPVRVELSTLADPRTYAQLAARDYRVIGFENVLACSLATPTPHSAAAIEIQSVTERMRYAVAGERDEAGIRADLFARGARARDVVRRREAVTPNRL